ncbi:MAG: hypothetical protein M5U28_56870 [Sandaracinaceae bacterium]|nr:hypothetical protein [Sandaracinaceae bacterium]
MAPSRADVRVVGVGGAGGNAIRALAAGGAEGVVCIAANTDTQALAGHPADVQLVLGRRATRGLGAGGKASAGLAAAQESAPSIVRAVEGADLVFVAAGLGGGTGTGAAPVVASLARDAGALVVGVVSLPFAFEGSRRSRLAAQGVEALAEHVDSLLVIENDRLLALGAEPTALEAFARADRVLADGVRGIGELVTSHGLVNLDFADVRAVLRDGGRAVMGSGAARGPDRAVRAVERAARSPLLAEDPSRARAACSCRSPSIRASASVASTRPRPACRPRWTTTRRSSSVCASTPSWSTRCACRSSPRASRASGEPRPSPPPPRPLRRSPGGATRSS